MLFPLLDSMYIKRTFLCAAFSAHYGGTGRAKFMVALWFRWLIIVFLFIMIAVNANGYLLISFGRLNNQHILRGNPGKSIL